MSNTSNTVALVGGGMTGAMEIIKKERREA